MPFLFPLSIAAGPTRSPRPALLQSFSFLSLSLFPPVLLLFCPALAAGATKPQVEADWQRQDECRVEEIRRPGVVRFAEADLDWPGVAGAGSGLEVPWLPPPVVDGRLADACWREAAEVPPCRPDEMVRPLVWLARDDAHLYVAARFPTQAEACLLPPSTAVDASGAVDGIKNGRYAFHTNREPNPWWQVDLSRRQPIGRIVIYNRLDYPPGLHNADMLRILISDDGRLWTQVYDNAGKPFGGVTDGKPLVVDFRTNRPEGRDRVLARFVRIQIPSAAPIFLHLDEVEVYGADDEKKNIALGRPADQSSRSRWSRGGALVTLGPLKIGLAVSGGTKVVAVDGKPLPAEQAPVVRQGGTTSLEIALPLESLPGDVPAACASYHGQPVSVALGTAVKLAWPDGFRPGFGKNRVLVELCGPGESDVTVQTMVFTPAGPRRQVVFEKKLAGPVTVPVEFAINDEGAAAVIVHVRRGKAESRRGECFFVEPVRETLGRIDRLVAEFHIALPEGLTELRARAEALSAREKAAGPDPDARRSLVRDARWMARRVALANPALDFDRLLLVKRFGQETYPDVCLNHMPWVSRPGGDLAVVSLDTPDEPAGENDVRCLLAGKLGPGHVHGMDLGWDADRVVFGFAQAKSSEPPEGWLDRRTSYELRRSEEPTHLFEINVAGTGLRQITDCQWSDLDPAYLPNGQIVFVSERCGYSLQCNEMNKDETSCNLYTVKPDGSNIRRLSVTKDGDYLPHVLDDGTIGYTRWEYHERGWAHIQSLWVIHPDGTGADALFKQHFNNPWAIEECRSIPGTKKFVAIATGHHTLPAGPLLIVDPRQGINSPEGIRIVTPGILPPEGGMAGHAVPQGGVRGTGGLCMTPWPLSQTTFLVARNYAGQVDPAGFGIYLVDVYGTMELLYRDPAISSFTPIPLRPRRQPPVLPDRTDPSLPYAVCALSNAGRGVDGVPPEKIRYLRISEPLAWPYDNTYGGQRYEPDVKRVMINWNPVRVIGIVPIESDGSAHFLVPVDTAVYFQLLDEDFMELRRMRSFISFQPGESRACNGCHETREEVSAARSESPLAMERGPSVPEPPPWGARPLSFLRDVQPVFDRNCAGCHGGLKPAAGLDFSGGLTAQHNRAYDTILAAGLIARSNVNDDAQITPPLAFGSHKSKLVEVLRKGACGKRAGLSRDDWIRVVTWIDANGPYHDRFINKRIDPPPYDLPADAALAEEIAAVHARRCAGCHQPADVSRLDWIDLDQPSESRFLSAPLAKEAGGAGRCTGSVYRDRSDPDYRAVFELVDAAVKKAWSQPRRDLVALRSDRIRDRGLGMSPVRRGSPDPAETTDRRSPDFGP